MGGGNDREGEREGEKERETGGVGGGGSDREGERETGGGEGE